MNIKILQLDYNIEEAEMLLFRDYACAKRLYPNRNDLLKLYKVVYEMNDYQAKTMDTSHRSICNDIFTGDTGSVLSLRCIGEKRGKQKKSAQQHPSFL